MILETKKESTWLGRRAWWVSAALDLQLSVDDQEYAKFELEWSELSLNDQDLKHLAYT